MPLTRLQTTGRALNFRSLGILLAICAFALLLIRCSGSSTTSAVTNSGTGTTGGSGTGSTPPPSSNPTDVTTYHNDVGRTGQNLSETLLSTSNVNSQSFGLLHNLMVDGAVDAEPLYLSQLSVAGTNHNVVFVATEND